MKVINYIMAVGGLDHKRTVARLFIIVAVGILVYSNTLNVPFVFDDNEYVLGNPFSVSEEYIMGVDEAESRLLHRNVGSTIRTRQLGYLTFALNQRLHGLNVKGYHVINILMHISTAIVLYALVVLTFRTPFIKRSCFSGYGNQIALFSSVLFVSHPLQTEAVTYITQRFTTMVTLLYLLCLVCYAYSRLSEKKFQSYLFYVISFISALLAMKTKEVAFTLPIAVAMYEFFFLGASTKKRVLLLLPLFLTMLIIPICLLDCDGSFLKALDGATKTQEDISRFQYLSTQPRVLLTYLRLVLLPVNQNFDYDFPIYDSLLVPASFVPLIMLLCLGLLGMQLHRRSVQGEALLRIVSFGILWFFLALSVESSFIALADVIFEHRMYLPLSGFVMAFVTLAFLASTRFGTKQNVLGTAVVAVLMVFATAAYARNEIWYSDMTLWEDAVGKSPGKSRAHNNLCVAYTQAERFEDAMEECLTALNLAPRSSKAHNNLGALYSRLGLYEDAIREYGTALKLRSDCKEAHSNLATAFMAVGQYDDAVKRYRIAVKVDPNDPRIHNNLALVYAKAGDYSKAVSEALFAISINPDYTEAHNNLGAIYCKMKHYEKSASEYREAIRLRPSYAKAHFNLAVLHEKIGMYEDAVGDYQNAIKAEPEYVEARNNLAVIYMDVFGMYDKAIDELKQALKINPGEAQVRRNLQLVKSFARQTREAD